MDWAVIVLCVFCSGRQILGAFIWTTFPSKHSDQITCDGSTADLIWDYTTDETVTSIEWYKQPGDRAIGNFALGSFIANTAYSDRVTQYQTDTYKAAIQILNFSSSDGGDYSCTVITTNDYKQTGQMKHGNVPVGNVVIDYSTRHNSTCFPPDGTSGVTITWTGTESKTGQDGVYGINTCKGGHVNCCMTGGSAVCGNRLYCVEEDIPSFKSSESSASNNSNCSSNANTKASTASGFGKDVETIIIAVAATSLVNIIVLI